MKTSLQVILILFVFLLQKTSVWAQQQPFSKVFYENTSSVQAYSLAATTDRGFIISGQWNNVAFALKMDSSGVIQWNKRIGENMLGNFNCIIPTIDSCFILAGSLYESNQLNSEIFCAKMNNSGDTIWTRSIDFGKWGYATSVFQTSDRGFVITGSLAQSGVITSLLFVAKLSEAGTVIWARTYESETNTIYAGSVEQTPDAGFVVMARMDYAVSVDPGVIMIKLTSDGQISWSKKYRVPLADYYNGGDALVTDDGFLCNFYVSAYYGSSVIMKTDFTGSVIWSNQYQTFSGYSFFSTTNPKIHITSEGSLLFVTAGQFGNLVKVDAEGNLLWIKDLFLDPVDVLETQDYGSMVIGNGPLYGVKKIANTSPQIGIIRADSQGNGTDCIWSNSTSYNPVTLDTSSVSFLVESAYTASVQHPEIIDGLLTTETGCVAFIGGLHENDPGNETFTIYPNPTHGIFTIKTSDVKTPGTTDLMVFNALGKLVYFSGQQDTGSSIDLSRQPDGIYLVRVRNNNKVISQKLIIQH